MKSIINYEVKAIVKNNTVMYRAIQAYKKTQDPVVLLQAIENVQEEFSRALEAVKEENRKLWEHILKNEPKLMDEQIDALRYSADDKLKSNIMYGKGKEEE